MTEEDYKKLSDICRAYDQISLLNRFHRCFPEGEVRVHSVEVFTSDGLFKLEEDEIDMEAVRALFKRRDEVLNSKNEQAKKAFERININFGDEESK
jgi:hypothetical protein